MSYKVFTVPSSDDENAYEDIASIEDAVALHTVRQDAGGDSGSLHEFDTEEEAEAFIKGYELAIGYMGNGFLVRNYIPPELLG